MAKPLPSIRPITHFSFSIILISILLYATRTAAFTNQKDITVTYIDNNIKIKEVIKELKKQTGYTLMYNNEMVRLNTEERISVKFVRSPVSVVMDQLVSGRKLTWRIDDESDIIFILPAEIGNKTKEIDTAINHPNITGKVTDELGNPLLGATVRIKESNQGTSTDVNGNFNLTNVNIGSQLAISCIGFQTQEIIVKGRSILARLALSIQELDETLVIAYGTTTRRLSTGNVIAVKAADIEKQPVSNALQALQGRVPGLVVSQTNGFASAPFRVEIRGRNTIDPTFTSDPLYVIDGVPLTVLEIGGNSSYLAGSSGFLQNGLTGPASGQNPLFSINPYDIESIEVLKDADATAIYGSRGANGAILITTKKGKSGKTTVSFRVNHGIRKVTRYWNMLNTEQYLMMRKEAFKNDNETPTAGTAPDLLSWDSARDANWQKTFWGGTGKNTEIQLGLSGGDDRTTFRINGGYNRLSDILTISGADQRGSASFNLNHTNSTRRLSVALTSNYSFTKSNMTDIPGNTTLAPNAPPIFDAVGKLNYREWEPVTYLFPFAPLMQPYSAKTNFFNTNLLLNYKLTKGLTIRSSIGYNNAYVRQEKFMPISSLDPNSAPLGRSQFGKNFNSSWIIEPQVEYNKSFNNVKLQFLIGSSLQNTETHGATTSGDGYTNDALLRTISNAPIQSASDNFGEYKYSAIFCRIGVNWDNRYILNANIRRDGSSNFGPGKQFGTFWSIAGAWIFTDEKWVKTHLDWLSFGKIRSSYGTTGGEGPSYGYLTRWQSVNPSYSGIQPLLPTQHANPNYRWQVNKKWEGAIEIGLLHEKVTLSAAHYRDRCSNQLVSYPIGAYTGFPSVIANSPAVVQNIGWEFTLATTLVSTKDFKWSLAFNTSINRNKLVAFPNFELSPYATSLVVGEPLNIKRLLKYTGVDPQTGLYTFEDKDKDGHITTNSNSPKDDFYYFNLNPGFTGGLGNNFSYKNIHLSIFLNIVKQMGVNAYASQLPGTMNNASVNVLDRWQKPGDISQFAKFTTMNNDVSYSNFGRSNAVYTDASFIRLSNVSLSYSLPLQLTDKIGLKSTSIFINCANLLVFTKYKGIDPETQNFGGMPPSKVITCGLSLNL
jgi:TonB-linked SusC/RagA family outer membrane protein